MTAAALKIPSTEESAQAQGAIRALSKILRKKSTRSIRVRPEGAKEDVSVIVPRQAFELFLDVLAEMANGNAVSIVPVHAELTTQQAADMLNVSRPFLVGILDEGRIPFRLVGTHRRVRVADLVAYQEKDAAQRKGVLDELAEEAQKHGLGY